MESLHSDIVYARIVWYSIVSIHAINIQNSQKLCCFVNTVVDLDLLLNAKKTEKHVVFFVRL